MSSSPNTPSNNPDRPQKVMIIDDEGAILLLVRRVLSDEGFDVTMCASAPEALTLLQEQFYDCIITDAIMPEMDGYEFAQKVRAHPALAGIPIIMLTRKRNREDIQSAIQIGVNDYIVKPIDEQLLINKVKAAIANQRNKTPQGFELSVQDMMESEAVLQIDCRITGITELGLKVQSPVPLKTNLWLQLHGTIFDRIGIDTPYLKVLDCTPPSQADGFHEVRLSFIGLKEKDASRIRAWMVKEAMARKKRNSTSEPS